MDDVTTALSDCASFSLHTTNVQMLIAVYYYVDILKNEDLKKP